MRSRNSTKILLLGGAGYLGSVLCRKLLDKYKIRVFDNLTYGEEGIKGIYSHKNFEFVMGDIRNISQVMDALDGIDCVIHLAALVGDSVCDLNRKKTIEINYLSSKSIAEACKINKTRLLFASTCSVYGASEKERLTEESPLNPVSLYAETKLKSEEGILSILNNATIFRIATLYGVSPRMRFDLVVNLMTAQALIDGKITIFGGEQWRPNLDVSDAANAFVKWVENPKSGIFNLGDNKQNYRISEIGKIIKKVLPKTKVEIKKQEDRRDYNVSFDKIKTLGFKARGNIEKGVREIRDLLLKEKITDYTLSKYNNYRFLLNYPPSVGFKGWG